MIGKRVQGWLHIVPPSELGLHQLNDGLWCCCCPSEGVLPKNDRVPVLLVHEEYAPRTRRVYQP